VTQLTPWSRVLLKKVIVTQTVKEPLHHRGKSVIICWFYPEKGIRIKIQGKQARQATRKKMVVPVIRRGRGGGAAKKFERERLRTFRP
jgi:hypothetical protein